MSSTCRVCATSCTRYTCAPLKAQIAVEARVPVSRSPTGRSRVSPTKSLFDNDTSTGQPVAVNSSRRRVISSECQVFLPKSWAGSMKIRSRGTPREAARSASAVVSAMASSTTSSYSMRCGRVRGVTPPVCVQTRPAPVSATTPASARSWPPQASLTRSAPAATASRATSERHVSMLMSTSGCRARTSATKPMTRRISSAASITSPGAALMPPMSTMSAPSSTTVSTRSNAGPSSQVAPRS